MMAYSIKQLNKFLGKAALATYASGKRPDPSSPDFVSRFPGFKELEYKEGDFYYRDSYAGFFRSAGQEVVWYKNVPIWTQIYYGGMEKKYQNDENFSHETFSFLKKALSHGEKRKEFQPRGEKVFSDRDWKYSCDWSGDITDFKGHEKLIYRNKLIFTHSFFGGLLKWK